MLTGIDILTQGGELAIGARSVGSPVYDFDFRTLVACRSLHGGDAADEIVLRVGAIADYAALEQALGEIGLRVVNDLAAHLLASELPRWYPALEGDTPRSVWFSSPPSASEVLQAGFRWPVFIKGARQTSRHKADRAIARDAEDFERVMGLFRADGILAWQSVVVRQFLPLRIVEMANPGGLPAAFEFRTFWWRGELVGSGPYWRDTPAFRWSRSERQEALAVARRAARAVEVPFLVVDVAQDVDGRWWVIELNDAQESGYAGCSSLGIWQRILGGAGLEVS